MKSLMRPFALAGCVVGLGGLSGCDNILGLDNQDPPTSVLSGNVVYNGQPVGLRSNGVTLELWQTDTNSDGSLKYDLNTKIAVQVDENGKFQALLYDGNYKLNALPNSGPWVTKPDTLRFEVKGGYTTDFSITPHYTLSAPTYVRVAPTTASPGGSVTVTFKVNKIDTTKALELVGLYVGTTTIVDRTNSLSIANGTRERTFSQIQTQFNNNQDITFTVPLPATIYQTSSPWVREYVFVRAGVKVSGLAELMYTPVVKLDLGAPL